MTYFQGYTSKPDSFDEWPNTLSIETSEGVAAGQVNPVPLVLVDTNYKPGRTGEHPVNLTVEDVLRATATLLGTAHDSLTENSYAEQPAHDVLALVGLLKRLTEVDEAAWELRTWLHTEIEHRLTPDDNETGDEGQADNAKSEAGQ